MIRYRVVAFAVALAAITYLDRVCISILAPYIQEDLHLSMEQMSYIFSSFTIAYTVFEIPTAWWADRSGTRSVLARIVASWSTFTIATAAAFNFWSMWFIRFLFGAGEAGAWPCVARTFERWIPAKERGKIQGIFFAGAHAAGGLTPIFITAILPFVHWRAIFVMFGCIGFIWSLAWYRWFRNEPAEHPSVTAEERRLIEEGRSESTGHSEGWEYWKRLLVTPNVWFLCLMYIGNVYAYYFCITWFPAYLEKGRGFSRASLGFFAGLPLLSSVLGDIFGGRVTDWAVAKYGLKIGRTGVGALGYIIAGIAMAIGAMTADPVQAVLWISFAVASTMFTLGASWSTCIDIGGKHSGVVSAAMNSAGSAAGIACPIIVTKIYQSTGDWNMPIFVMSGLFFFGAVCWLLIDPRKKVFE